MIKTFTFMGNEMVHHLNLVQVLVVIYLMLENFLGARSFTTNEFHWRFLIALQTFSENFQILLRIRITAK